MYAAVTTECEKQGVSTANTSSLDIIQIIDFKIGKFQN